MTQQKLKKFEIDKNNKSYLDFELVLTSNSLLCLLFEHFRKSCYKLNLSFYFKKFTFQKTFKDKTVFYVHFGFV